MKYLSFFLLFFVLFVAFFIPPVATLKWGSVDVSLWDKKRGEIKRNLYPGSPDWYPVEEVSHMTLAAIISAEDAFFYEHPGVDLASMWESLLVNYKAGHIKRGASTITQQVVRLAFLNQKRSYLRKIREALGALLLEYILTKDEILAWYLNLIYFGHGHVGIKEASKFYFSTEPMNLNLNNSIQLALVLPRPTYFAKQLKEKKLNKMGQTRFYFILKELRNKGSISQLQWKSSLATGNFGTAIDIRPKP